MMGISEDNARLPNVAARRGRRKGSLALNRGWKVEIEHVVAKADDWVEIS